MTWERLRLAPAYGSFLALSARTRLIRKGSVGSPRGGVAFVRGRTIKSAFASYASKDRRQVLARVQGIEKLWVNVFVVVRNLKSNDPYQAYLLAHVDKSDVLSLFWSRHEKNRSGSNTSAMGKHGIDFIDPVPLVDPRNAPPPNELGDQKHFNDWVLAYIEAELIRQYLAATYILFDEIKNRHLPSPSLIDFRTAAASVCSDKSVQVLMGSAWSETC